ncbi:MAG TPA: penicillin acylase family protein [Candidatus Hydrogenedentes bacterium]|nr:penicillin acylase family protein [Candidatus Hydrogenedentota bacterium]HPG68777.1 penicillin acylase family protein [Candidatus Hydrogenedentota bacterium]
MKLLLVKVVMVAVGSVVLALGLWVAYLARTHQPDLDRVVFHDTVQAPMRVVRDDWGVPHIQAENEPDAYFALGYVMAQDRLFQMEVLRRFAQGRLAEILGPPAVPFDKIARTFQFRFQAEQSVSDPDLLPPEARRAVDAFVAGINHCMEVEPLPFEFSVLQIPVEPFTATDCLTVVGILPVTFADGLREDPVVSILKERNPELDIEALFPEYRYETPVTVMENVDEAKAYLEQQAKAAPKGTPGDASGCAVALTSFLEPLATLSRLFGPALGSNSWVLAPSRTASGKPILANDPHIAFTNPSVWYEAHVQFGDFNLYGHYLPLVPFALLGHNDHHAWGLTMFANDDVDLYVETFQPENPNKVMYKGEWVDVETRRETIRVRFGRDVTHDVRVTPHGAIITDLYRMLYEYSGPDIALWWSWQHVPYTDVQGAYRMGWARNYDEFAEAVPLFTSPGLNISYADRDGNIAWWAAGLITIRPDHVNHKSLLDGASGRDEVLGFVPFDQNPHLKNPEWGYIVSANNKSTVKPVGPVRSLQGYWQPIDRAARIEEMIETRQDWTIDALRTVQFDDHAYAAPTVVQCFLDVLRPIEGQLDPIQKEALGILAGWDYCHGLTSAGACVYGALCEAVLRNAVEDELGSQLFPIYSSLADGWNFFKHLVGDAESEFWDDVTTPSPETRTAIMAEALSQAVATLERRMGPDTGAWGWGKLHTIEFKHPFGYLPLVGRIFNVGPFPASGAEQVINNMIFFGGPEGHYSVVAGPSTRRLIDFADPEHSLSVLPTGNSGHFLSPHYDDQAELFLSGRYREPRLTDEQIDASKRHVMEFKPLE